MVRSALNCGGGAHLGMGPKRLFNTRNDNLQCKLIRQGKSAYTYKVVDRPVFSDVTLGINTFGERKRAKSRVGIMSQLQAGEILS